MQDSFGGFVTSVYDAADRLTSRQSNGGTGSAPVRIDLAYSARDQVTTITRYSDLAGSTKVGESAYVYDATGMLSNLQHKNGSSGVLANYTYTYDLAHRVVTETYNGTAKNYSYDNTNQLLSDGTNNYTFDANGNRTMTGYQTGTGNRTTNDGIWTYTYDDQGNLTKKSKGASAETVTFAYDNENRMIGMSDRSTDGGTLQTLATYVYDALSNRSEKDVWSGGTTTVTRFAYDDGGTAWADLNGSSSLTTRRVYLDDVDSLGARVASGAVAWYLPDRLGSIRNQTDASGVLSNTITYDAFGKVTNETSASAGDRFKFTGRELDTETGFQFHHARYYDPLTGKWTTADPSGFGAGDANLYRYVRNSPTRARDSSGLDPDGTIPPRIPGSSMFRPGEEEIFRAQISRLVAAALANLEALRKGDFEAILKSLQDLNQYWAREMLRDLQNMLPKEHLVDPEDLVTMLLDKVADARRAELFNNSREHRAEVEQYRKERDKDRENRRVREMTPDQRRRKAAELAGNKLPDAIRAQLAPLFTAKGITILLLSLGYIAAAGAAAHIIGGPIGGAIFDSTMIALFGFEGLWAILKIMGGVYRAEHAQTAEELDAAAQQIADALAGLSIDLVMAIVMWGAGKAGGKLVDALPKAKPGPKEPPVQTKPVELPQPKKPPGAIEPVKPPAQKMPSLPMVKTCFVAGTPLLTPDGEKAIERFRPGDLLLSRLEDDVEGPVESKSVVDIFVRVAPILELHVGGKIIRTTAEHPFYVVGGGWRAAEQLCRGDLLCSHDQSVRPVDRIVKTQEVTTVYNLQIANYHTYFVGSSEWGFSVWAHNADGYEVGGHIGGGWYEIRNKATGEVVNKVQGKQNAIEEAARLTGEAAKAAPEGKPGKTPGTAPSPNLGAVGPLKGLKPSEVRAKAAEAGFKKTRTYRGKNGSENEIWTHPVTGEEIHIAPQGDLHAPPGSIGAGPHVNKKGPKGTHNRSRDDNNNPLEQTGATSTEEAHIQLSPE